MSIEELRALVAGEERRLLVSGGGATIQRKTDHDTDPVQFGSGAALHELRADDTDHDAFTIRGHAAVFDRLSEDLGGFREKIARGAFRKALDRGDDVRLLFNHDANFVLARTKAGTLDLRENPRGLHVYADVAPTSYAADLRVLMGRRDVDQMSFGFTVARDEWTERDGEVIRTIREIDRLFDVSVVTYPAYPQTDAAARELIESSRALLHHPTREEIEEIVERVWRVMTTKTVTTVPSPPEAPAEELDAAAAAVLAEAGLTAEGEATPTATGDKRGADPARFTAWWTAKAHDSWAHHRTTEVH